MPRKSNPSLIDEPIENVLTAMNECGPNSEKFRELIVYLDRLTDIKAKDAKKKVNPDTWVTVGGSILGILVVVAYEQKHVFGSKAIQFISRLRTS